MCRIIGASKSGFYRWMKAQWGYVSPYEKYLLFWIKITHGRSKGRYGSRRVFWALRSQGFICYLNQIARIMKKYGIKAKTKRKFRTTTDSRHSLGVAPNLLNRDFTADQLNRVWVGDITYIWTREGWLYLSTVIDLCSRRVVGWSLDSHMTKNLVISSFNKAVKERRPCAGLIFHSDRGSQYASDEFKRALGKTGAVQSMSRKGDCWDNAVAESFFKTIKSELVYWEHYKTRYEAELSIFEYIEMFYNRSRLHSAINYMSPCAFENKKLS